MNLFVVGSGAAGTLSLARVQRVLEQVAAPLPGLGRRPSDGWAAPDGAALAACLSHDPESIGGVRYHHFGQDEMALFAGRPIIWRSDREADGQGPLDPRLYLAPVESWRNALDGRYAVARWGSEGHCIDVLTDPLGAMHVYSGSAGDATWVSNSPLVVARLVGDEGWSPEVLASFLGCGWSLSGDPLWRAVRRVPRGTRLVLRDGRAEEKADLLPDQELRELFGASRSLKRSAETIIATSRALADWPGRAAVVGLSGGFDSRIALAGLLRAGWPCTVITKAFPGAPGYPETADVVVARQVCAAVNLPQLVVDVGGVDHPLTHAERAVSLLRAAGPGTLSLSDSDELPMEAEAEQPLLFSGTGADLAALVYQTGKQESTDRFGERLLAKMSPRFPARLINAAGEQVISNWIRGWVERYARWGISTSELPTLFHLLVRLGSWYPAGPATRDFAFETVQPLATAHLLPQQLTVTFEERTRQHWQRVMAGELRPDLALIPYESFTENIKLRVLQEVRRRLALEGRRLRGSRAIRQREPFLEAFEISRAAVSASPQHPAWQVLDRRRVEHLLRGDPERLDPRSRQQVLRLGTVFIGA